MGQQQKGKNEGLVIWDCGSPLYDSFELASLSHIIDRNTMVVPSLLPTTSFQSSSSSSSFSSWPSASTLSAADSPMDSGRSLWTPAELAAPRSNDGGSIGGYSGRWWELNSKKRKLEDMEIDEAPSPKKAKNEGCFCFGFLK